MARTVPGGMIAGVVQDKPDMGISHLTTSMGPRPGFVHWSQAEGRGQGRKGWVLLSQQGVLGPSTSSFPAQGGRCSQGGQASPPLWKHVGPEMFPKNSSTLNPI